ncbi:helix-turn-helix domain-containing protein [Nocardia vulneris]|uniref:winged helix-turn-helix transcriptional regulator n=1 Tax=Nocardia vulneris TaxID=1141657 RepID=UPI0030D436E5
MSPNIDPEELFADCRIRTGAELFSHRWDMVVLAALHDGPHRRSELRERVGELSDKSLAETLRRLTGFGLITSHRFAERPPRVEYELTVLGMSLLDGPVRALGRWMYEHGAALADAVDPAGKESQLW